MEEYKVNFIPRVVLYAIECSIAAGGLAAESRQATLINFHQPKPFRDKKSHRSLDFWDRPWRISQALPAPITCGEGKMCLPERAMQSAMRAQHCIYMSSPMSRARPHE